MWGTGYLWGIGAALILYLLIQSVDRNYYHRKRTIIKQRKAQLREKKLERLRKTSPKKTSQTRPPNST